MLGNFANIKFASVYLSESIELRNGFILGIIFQDIQNILPFIRRNHLSAKERIPALCFHFIKLRFCQIFFCCTKRLEQGRKRIHQIFIGILCAVVDHYLISVIHSVFFKICKRIHTNRDSLLKRHFFQRSSINCIIQNSCKLLNLGNSNHAQISFGTLRFIILKVIVSIK